MRERLGEALRIPQRERAELDCIESDDIFVVIKPGSIVDRSHVADLSPLLRQSVVAACAAFETYMADTIMKEIGGVMRNSDPLPTRYADITLNVAQWWQIQDGYKRRGWGLRELVIEPRIRELSSTVPSQVGQLLSLLGVRDWVNKVNRARGRSAKTVEDLDRIATRRNRIAHEGDRVGRGRAAITIDEALDEIEVIESIATAIESVVASETAWLRQKATL
jgi:hypothetical protein